MTDELAPDYFARLFPGDPLAVTMFTAADLQRKPQAGRVWLSSWPWLVVWTQSPAVVTDKAEAGGITFARCRDGVRRKSHVECVTLLVIDHDAGAVEAKAASAALSKYTHIVHTTASHTVDVPRWRALIAVSRPMDADEHALVWRHTAAATGAAGIQVDVSAKDPCRLWYAPTIRTLQAPFEHYEHEGVPVDVDRILERARRPKPTPQRGSVPTPQHRDKYTAAALQRASKAVTEATPGERHYTLCREAHSLARDELGLTDSEIQGALAPAFVSAAGERRANEGERTIADAIEARRKGAK